VEAFKGHMKKPVHGNILCDKQKTPLLALRKPGFNTNYYGRNIGIDRQLFVKTSHDEFEENVCDGSTPLIDGETDMTVT
jgi:hypothetical protein